MSNKKYEIAEDEPTLLTDSGAIQYKLFRDIMPQQLTIAPATPASKAKWGYVESIRREVEQTQPNSIYTLDLFSGCGGLTLGFKMAGYTSALATDIDENCEKTFATNFPDVPFICGDITAVEEEQFRRMTGEKRIDVIIGGPPCQGFSLANKRRNTIDDDPRNRLFRHYVKVLGWYRPKVFVMENVRGLLSMHKGEVLAEILRSFSEVGYDVDYRVLKASDYGVPQARERVIIIGVRKDLGRKPAFPEAVIAEPVTVDEAVMDLPQISACEGMDDMAHMVPPQNAYQALMRRSTGRVRNHIAMRHTPRLVARFHAIKQGQSLIDVWETHGSVKRGDPTKKSDIKFSQNNQRLFGNLPAPTIAASFQSNFVHPWLDRNFTAREGARLQSFPDDFVFEGFRTKMSWEKGLSQYQQIGNAVPPLLAYAIAKTIYAKILN